MSERRATANRDPHLPEEIRAGTYSDVVLVWHNEWGFTFVPCPVGPDPVAVGEEAEGDGTPNAGRVAGADSPGGIFPLLKALNVNLAAYE